MTVFEKIKEQQAECKGRPAWYVGEQLADICRNDPHAAEIVEQDLTVPEMSIQAAAERAAEAARKDLADAKKCAEKQVKDACASARREAQAEACKKAEKELEDARKKAAEAIKTQEEAAAAAAQAKARADALEKKLKMASPALALFRSRFEDLQAEVQRLRSMLTTIRQDDQDTAAKLTAALAAYFESEAKKT